MTKSKAQKMRAKLGLKGPAQRNALSAELGVLRARATNAPGAGKRARRRRNRQGTIGPQNLIGPRLPTLGMGRRGMGGTRKLPSGVSMVNDGVNVGSVWKNTTAERVTFPLAREKFSDLVSTGAVFEIVEQLYVNPGNITLFPIFAEIAKCYEEYVPNVLRIYFRTEEHMASGSVVSAGLGAMAVDFDANDALFTSMTQLENYSHAISGAPFSGIMCLDVLEELNNRRRNGQRGNRGKDLSQNNYYTYYSANAIGPTNDQAKFYDVGNFQFALANTQATTGVGELWIEYSFTMIRRKSPETSLAFQAIAGHFKNNANDATTASPLGLTPATSISVQTGSTLSKVNMGTSIGSYGPLTVGFNDTSDTVINLPNVDANWLVYCYWSAATAIAAAGALTTANGAAQPSIWGPGPSAMNGFFLAAGTSACYASYVQSSFEPTPTVGTNSCTVSGLTSMTDGNLDIFLVRLPDTLLSVMPEEDRLTQLERMVKELTMRNLDDWNCRPSDDKRKPQIPLRSQECDEKSVISTSSMGKARFFK